MLKNALLILLHGFSCPRVIFMFPLEKLSSQGKNHVITSVFWNRAGVIYHNIF